MAGANPGSREQILERVRQAMTRRADKRELVSSGAIFSPVKDPMERFLAECQANFTEVVVTPDRAATAAALREVLASLPAGEVYVQDAPQLRELMFGAAGGRSVCWSSEGPPAESSQATVTFCEALVAMTGSVLTSSGCGGRGASVVAPCHIVVARAEQLVPDLEAAMERAQQIAPHHSFVGLITGCSRTADIEKLLVIGAHGPRRLVVILQQ
ncbi:MAG: lactate utilization protein C [Terriglobales bacterium]